MERSDHVGVDLLSFFSMTHTHGQCDTKHPANLESTSILFAINFRIPDVLGASPILMH